MTTIINNIEQTDLKIIDNTYILKTEYFKQYLDNNKIENVIINKILKIGLGKNEKINLTSYYYKNGEQINIHQYKAIKTNELLKLELKTINEKYNKTNLFIIDEFMNPICLGTMEIFIPIIKEYLFIIHNILYNDTYKILMITPRMELNYLINKFNNN